MTRTYTVVPYYYFGLTKQFYANQNSVIRILLPCVAGPGFLSHWCLFSFLFSLFVASILAYLRHQSGNGNILEGRGEARVLGGFFESSLAFFKAVTVYCDSKADGGCSGCGAASTLL